MVYNLHEMNAIQIMPIAIIFGDLSAAPGKRKCTYKLKKSCRYTRT